MKKFNKLIREWLLPLGYEECYRINHPTETNNEVHFSKDGIRVVCIKDLDEEYCYLHKDILNDKITYAIITGRYTLGTDELEQLHKFMKGWLGY